MIEAEELAEEKINYYNEMKNGIKKDRCISILQNYSFLIRKFHYIIYKREKWSGYYSFFNSLRELEIAKIENQSSRFDIEEDFYKLFFTILLNNPNLKEYTLDDYLINYISAYEQNHYSNKISLVIMMLQKNEIYTSKFDMMKLQNKSKSNLNIKKATIDSKNVANIMKFKNVEIVQLEVEESLYFSQLIYLPKLKELNINIQYVYKNLNILSVLNKLHNLESIHVNKYNDDSQTFLISFLSILSSFTNLKSLSLTCILFYFILL